MVVAGGDGGAIGGVALAEAPRARALLLLLLDAEEELRGLVTVKAHLNEGVVGIGRATKGRTAVGGGGATLTCLQVGGVILPTLLL